MQSQDSGKVQIHGKTYQTVAYRLTQFRDKYPIESGWLINTAIIDREGDAVIFKAEIITPEGKTVAVGHAEETRGASHINRTSALENAETSAIGRALANAGFVGNEFASANEVENAKHQQAAPRPKADPWAARDSRKLSEIDTSSLEKELEADVSWVSEKMPFSSAENYTWQQCGEQECSIILRDETGAEKGRKSGASYLHTLVDFADIPLRLRVKAKVALALFKDIRDEKKKQAAIAAVKE